MFKGLPHWVNSGAFEMLQSPHMGWTELAQEQINYTSNYLLINIEDYFSV